MTMSTSTASRSRHRHHRRDNHKRGYGLGKVVAVCPQCGRRTFKPYVDASGHVFHPECGRCNREINCGYHRPPRDFTGESSPAKRSYRPERKPVAPPAVSTIAQSYVDDNSLRGWMTATLTDYLSELFSRIAIDQAYRHYYVGAWPVGEETGIVWWMIDPRQRVHSGKVMTYGADGHRRRDPSAVMPTTWMHTLLKISNFKCNTCFFGSHLLATIPDSDADYPVVLVESEKTALMLHLYTRHSPDCQGCRATFLATGGRSLASLDPSRLDDPDYRWTPLKGRRIILLPDADSVDYWQQIADIIADTGKFIDVSVVDIRQAGATGSEDAADIVERLVRPRMAEVYGYVDTFLAS